MSDEKVQRLIAEVAALPLLQQFSFLEKFRNHANNHWPGLTQNFHEMAVETGKKAGLPALEDLPSEEEMLRRGQRFLSQPTRIAEVHDNRSSDELQGASGRIQEKILGSRQQDALPSNEEMLKRGQRFLSGAEGDRPVNGDDLPKSPSLELRVPPIKINPPLKPLSDKELEEFDRESEKYVRQYKENAKGRGK